MGMNADQYIIHSAFSLKSEVPESLLFTSKKQHYILDEHFVEGLKKVQRQTITIFSL